MQGLPRSYYLACGQFSVIFSLLHDGYNCRGGAYLDK